MGSLESLVTCGQTRLFKIAGLNPPGSVSTSLSDSNVLISLIHTCATKVALFHLNSVYMQHACRSPLVVPMCPTHGPKTLICYHDGCAMSDCVNVGAATSRSTSIFSPHHDRHSWVIMMLSCWSVLVLTFLLLVSSTQWLLLLAVGYVNLRTQLLSQLELWTLFSFL